MAATNDFLAFAGGGSANVISQAAYLALASSLVQNGFSIGTAQSAEVNKVWRQSSIMAAVLAQLICDITGDNATDDGTTDVLLANLKTALAPVSTRMAVAGGTSDALTAALTIPWSAVVGNNPLYIMAAFANTTQTPTFFPNGATGPLPIMKANGQPLLPGDIAGAGHWRILQFDYYAGGWILANPNPANILSHGLAATLGNVALNNLTVGGVLSGLTPASADNEPVMYQQSLTSGTWADVTASRALGITYTNPKARPLVAHVTLSNTSGSPSAVVGTVGSVTLIDNKSIQSGWSDDFILHIPAGQTYELAAGSGSPTLKRWTELGGN